MTIREAARSTYRLFTAVLAGACWARYRAIASTERKGFAMFRNSLLHAFSALGSSTIEGAGDRQPAEAVRESSEQRTRPLS